VYPSVVLHVKHPLALVFATVLLSCQGERPSPPPHADPPTRPTPVDVLTVDSSRPLPDATTDLPRPVAQRHADWAEAYDPRPLPDARVISLQLAAQSEGGELAEHAAFVLGRRLAVERISSVLSVLPSRLLPQFARGASGRGADAQPATLPTTVFAALSAPHPDVALATWVFRSRKPVQGVRPDQMRRLLASPREDDQLAGARLLVSPSVDAPFDLIEYLRPIPMAVAFRSVSLRASTVPAWWHRWVDSLSLRVRANPRAWGNTWLALLDSVPRTDVEVRSALLAALPTLREVSTGSDGVDAAFRCRVASTLDSLNGAITAIPTCAEETFRWRSLVARIRYTRERNTDPQRAGILAQVLRDSSGDLRVLEALPEAIVELPVGLARPMLQEIAASRDPGVLAALLEALVLHVQHARTLPSSMREQLIRAPFGLDEATSLEARQQAIALARALNMRTPDAPSTVRAMQQAMNPDAGINPAATNSDTNEHEGTLVVNTSRGRVVIELNAASAPQATSTVIEAARGGRYNGTTFHRVVPAFVAQGGDPRGDGYGGTNTIVPTELSGMRFDRGAVGIALAGLDTGGMQFFVVTADAPHLDARYPWIGRVVEGMEIVDEMMEGDVIERVDFESR
jgi:cyclophilin family peptidyl-prolyl cis-trans isomerase